MVESQQIINTSASQTLTSKCSASIGWDGGEQRVSVTLGSKVLELWIGKNKAMVNGQEKFLDAGNPEVVPLILPPGRTMLPLRFVAEALGCDVLWDGQTRSVTVTSGGWVGNWQTDYGPLKLQQQGNRVSGTYDDGHSTISGTVSGNKLAGTWKDWGSTGDLEFTLSPDNKSFTGKWQYSGESEEVWRQWNGTKN